MTALDPMDPWSGDVEPTLVPLPEPAPDEPPVAPPPDLPPAPGPRRTWADDPAGPEPIPLPQERRPSGT